MADIRMGFIMKKKTVKYKLKTYQTFELLDLAIGIHFTNTHGKEVCEIVTGTMAQQFAWCNFNDCDEDDFIFWTANLEKMISDNDNKVEYLEFKKKFEKLFGNCTYQLKNGELVVIKDEKLLEYLESLKQKTSFDAEEFTNETDISKMYNSIKKTIISQDEQIMQILTALFKNQKVINSDLDSDLIAKLKENVIICGSTGTGKTEILKRISKLYNIPIVIEDATSLSEVGYQGRDVTDMLNDLYMAANKDLEVAQKGILVIDEFDKLAEHERDGQTHVSRFGVQRALLKLLDGSELYFDNKKFDTSRLTIVALGAFTGITSNDEYNRLTTDDFMKYGIMRELIGRFSKIVAMNPLRKEDIIQILKHSDFSPLNTYQELFKMLNVEFVYQEDFVEYIADLAIAKNSGARSLKTVFDECIGGALFRIFAGEYKKINLIKPQVLGDNAYILN